MTALIPALISLLQGKMGGGGGAPRKSREEMEDDYARKILAGGNLIDQKPPELMTHGQLMNQQQNPNRGH